MRTRSAAEAAATRLAVRVIPGAARDEVRWDEGRGWVVRVAAAAVDGAANERLCRFLAREVLDLPASGVRLRSGATSRQKTLEVDLDPAAVDAALRRWGAQ